MDKLLSRSIVCRFAYESASLQEMDNKIAELCDSAFKEQKSSLACHDLTFNINLYFKDNSDESFEFSIHRNHYAQLDFECVHNLYHSEQIESFCMGSCKNVLSTILVGYTIDFISTFKIIYTKTTKVD